MVIWTIIILKKDILVLNVVTKCHKIVLKITGLKRPDRTSSKIVFFMNEGMRHDYQT